MIVTLSKLLPYTKIALQEFKGVKTKYSSWVEIFDNEFEHSKFTNYKEGCESIKVPKITMRIPLDQFEGVDEEDPDEW